MAHNTRVFDPPVVFAQTIGPAELNALDVLVSESLNGDQGGVWYNVAPIILGGAGFQVGVSSANVDAIVATGNGTGDGIVATGGATSGIGGNFIGGAPDGVGVQGQGTGSGFGGGFIGGATGTGLVAFAGGGNAAGIKSQGDGTGPDIECLAGPILFSGTQPASTANPGKNRLHATNVVKAWAVVSTDGLGAATVLDGFNVASATAASAVLTLNLVEPVAANYGVSPNDMSTPINATSRVFGCNKSASTGSAVKLFGRTITSGAVANVDFAAEVVVVYVEVLGRQ